MPGQRPLTPEEVETLSHTLALGEYGKRKVFMFWFALKSGWKQARYLDLQYRDVFDADGLRLSLRPPLQDNGALSTPHVREALTAWVQELEQKDGVIFTANTYLCVGRVKRRQGRPLMVGRISRESWYRDFDMGVWEAGIRETLGVECLRKTFAANLYARHLREGGPRFGDIARALGLRSPTVALQYLSFVPHLLD